MGWVSKHRGTGALSLSLALRDSKLLNTTNHLKRTAILIRTKNKEYSKTLTTEGRSDLQQ
jgi:hypothetical protein